MYKRLREIKGYHYFGARYYDSDVSVWLSVDPMADKYPGMSPYMYTAGNPVMLVDPDGRSIETSIVINRKTGEAVYVDDGIDKIYIMSDKDFGMAKYYANHFDNKCRVGGALDNYWFDVFLGSAHELDLDSDVGLLFRLNIAEFGAEYNNYYDMLIASESVMNRVAYNGIYKNYDGGEQFADNVHDVIYASGGYAQSPTKKEFIAPFSDGYRKLKKNRWILTNAAEAAYKTYHRLEEPIGFGVLFYHSYHLNNEIKARHYLEGMVNANYPGDLLHLFMDDRISSIGAMGGLKR